MESLVLGQCRQSNAARLHPKGLVGPGKVNQTHPYLGCLWHNFGSCFPRSCAKGSLASA
jgi:hypothetical protein